MLDLFQHECSWEMRNIRKSMTKQPHPTPEDVSELREDELVELVMVVPPVGLLSRLEEVTLSDYLAMV